MTKPCRPYFLIVSISASLYIFRLLPHDLIANSVTSLTPRNSPWLANFCQWNHRSSTFHLHMGGDLAPSLGGRKKIRGSNFQVTLFRKKFPFLWPKFLMTIVINSSIFRFSLSFSCL